MLEVVAQVVGETAVAQMMIAVVILLVTSGSSD